MFSRILQYSKIVATFQIDYIYIHIYIYNGHVLRSDRMQDEVPM
jgi:hypothetical protein